MFIFLKVKSILRRLLTLKIIEVIVTLLTLRYVIEASKIVKIIFFTLIPELDFQIFFHIFPLSKALHIYKRLIPTIYTQRV